MRKKGKKNRKNIIVEGIIRKTKGGFGFLENDRFDKDIFIRRNHLDSAMEGDRVEVELLPEFLWKGGPEGFVVKIKERATKEIVGTLEKNKKNGFLIPMGDSLKEDVFIPQKWLNGAKNGDKIIVEIRKFPENQRLAEGEVIKIIARANDADRDTKAISEKYGLVKEFSHEVIIETKKVAKEVDGKIDYNKRADFRNLEVVTIDGKSSKDLDDGVSLTINEKGNYILGVHIADVSEFVKEESKLNEEALVRGNSVYLIDYVIPMLPEILSNGLCSLNEGEDRLTLSCIMEINKEGKLIDYRIVESVINSNARLNYDEVSDFLEGNNISCKVEEHKEMLKNMENLALILRKVREDLGSIDFDIDEAEFEIGEKGIPLDIFVSERRIANRIIEEFMLMANKTVAEHYFWVNIPFIYRVHEKPLPEKIAELRLFLRGIEISLPLNEGNLHPLALVNILEKSEEMGLLSLVSTVMVRTMQKAFYSSECLGHYGLAFKYYCHFTSPIRRYSDLWIHRIIKKQLSNDMDKKKSEKYEEEAEIVSKIVSQTERKAISMEREIEKIKKAQFMKKLIGYEAEGIISGVIGNGFFVQLENTVEGLVPIDTLMEDYYLLDKENYRLVGERTGKVYSLGDRVNVICTNVDEVTGRIDFKLAEK